MKYFFKAVVVILGLCIAMLSAEAIFVSQAAAQALSSSQGLSISPFLLERQMQKGEITDEIIDIINTSDRPLPVNITVNDFTPVGDNGQQVFLDPGQGDAHFSLSSWIQIKSNPKPFLQPREKTSVSFTITAPHNADEGGHYGALLFSFQGAALGGSSAVAVAQKLGAIILVKLGKASESGQISKFETAKSFYDYPPVDFITRFKNTGNVHVKPRGSISISNMFGKKIASVLVNENVNNVLPGTERDFKSTWKDTFGFGRYTAVEKIVYGDSGQVETSTTSFWVIPWKVTLVVAIILFLALVILIWGVRRYNRWLLSQAYVPRKPAPRTKRASPAKKK